MISFPDSVNALLKGSKIYGDKQKGTYAHTVTVKYFNENNPCLLTIEPLKWIYRDENNQTWVIVHKNYEFNLWKQIYLLHDLARNLAKVSLANPSLALASILNIQHLFNAILQSVCHYKIVNNFLVNHKASPSPSFNLSEDLFEQFEKLKVSNPIEYVLQLKKQNREGSLGHTFIAFDNFGKLCSFYEIDPFPFDLGQVNAIPAPVLSLCLKIKRVALFLTDNIDELTKTPQPKIETASKRFIL